MQAIFYSGKLKGRYDMEELGVDGRVIFKWIFEECVMRAWNRIDDWLWIEWNGLLS
jgi:hypothetical protein